MPSVEKFSGGITSLKMSTFFDGETQMKSGKMLSFSSHAGGGASETEFPAFAWVLCEI